MYDLYVALLITLAIVSTYSTNMYKLTYVSDFFLTFSCHINLFILRRPMLSILLVCETLRHLYCLTIKFLTNAAYCRNIEIALHLTALGNIYIDIMN